MVQSNPLDPSKGVKTSSVPDGTDSAHDRRVRACLAELAAEGGLSVDEVLVELNAAMAAGRPLVETASAAVAKSGCDGGAPRAGDRPAPRR